MTFWDESVSVGRQSDCQLTGSQINEMIFYTRPLSNQFDSSLKPVFIEIPPVGRKKKAITFKTVNKNSREELRRIIISSIFDHAFLMAILSRLIRSVCNFHPTIKRQLIRNSPRLFFKTNYATAALWKTSSSAVQNVHKNGDSPMLHVTWSDSTSSRFPFVYLRDNCQCPECFHESSLQRNYDSIAHLNMEIQPERVDVLQKGKQISLTWPDKHISVFNSQWLHARRLLEEKDMKERPSSLRKEGVIFWNAERLNGRIPRHDFQEIVDDDLKLYEWLYSLHAFGIALVTNVPVEPGQVDKLSSRIGFVKPTHYGYENDKEVNIITFKFISYRKIPKISPSMYKPLYLI